MSDVVWKARDESVGDLVMKCARKEISFDDLYERFAEMGFSTRYLYEAVHNAELSLKDKRP